MLRLVGQQYLLLKVLECYFRNTINSLSIFSRDSHLISLCSFIYRTAVHACMIVLSDRISPFILSRSFCTRLIVATLLAGY